MALRRQFSVSCWASRVILLHYPVHKGYPFPCGSNRWEVFVSDPLSVWSPDQRVASEVTTSPHILTFQALQLQGTLRKFLFLPDAEKEVLKCHKMLRHPLSLTTRSALQVTEMKGLQWGNTFLPSDPLATQAPGFLTSSVAPSSNCHFGPFYPKQIQANGATQLPSGTGPNPDVLCTFGRCDSNLVWSLFTPFSLSMESMVEVHLFFHFQEHSIVFRAGACPWRRLFCLSDRTVR